MRRVIEIIMLPALVLAFAACGDEATSDGGSSTSGGTGGMDSGVPDSGSSCSPACASPLVCNAATDQCACPSGAPPCGTACCADNFTCATNPFQCVCNLTYCGSNCINTINDPMNCGGCGKVCDGGVTCSNYACNYPIPDSGPTPDSGPPDMDAGPPVPDGGLPGLGQPCNPNANPDVCFTNYGLACNTVQLPDSGTTASNCGFPNEIAQCRVDVGCATTVPPLFCSSGFTDGTGNPVNICVNHCTTTPDCPDPLCNCIQGPTAQNICFLNRCGPAAVPANGTTYYAPCDAAGTNDGFCLPFFGGTLGFCAQGGTIADNQPCGLGIRTGDGGTAELCSLGSQCVGFNSGSSLCTPSCTPDGGVAGGPCPASNTCFPFSNNTDYGFCLQDCDPANSTCPPPLSCAGFISAGINECLP